MHTESGSAHLAAVIPPAEFQAASLLIRTARARGNVRLLLPSAFVRDDPAAVVGPPADGQLLAIWRRDPNHAARSTLESLAVWLVQQESRARMDEPLATQESPFHEWRLQSVGGLPIVLHQLTSENGMSELYHTVATIQLPGPCSLRVIATGPREDDWQQAAHILRTLAYRDVH